MPFSSRNGNPTTIRAKNNFRILLFMTFWTHIFHWICFLLMEWRRQSFHLNTNLIVQLCLGLFTPDTNFSLSRLPSVVPIHFIVANSVTHVNAMFFFRSVLKITSSDGFFSLDSMFLDVGKPNDWKLFCCTCDLLFSLWQRKIDGNDKMKNTKFCGLEFVYVNALMAV